MQTKYKMQPHERKQAVDFVKSYKAYKADILNEEKSILSLNSGKYETIGDERVYQPHGKGGKSAPTEDKALQLHKLHSGYKARCVQAVEYAFASLPIKHYTPELQKKLKQEIFESYTSGRKFKFERSGIVGIERSHFYQLRSFCSFKIMEYMKKW